MVIIKIMFGMGNQLFKYATARCVSHRLNNSADRKEKILKADCVVALHVRGGNYRELPFRVLFGGMVFRNTTISGSNDGIIPDDWIKIQCNFETNFNVVVSPILSIVLFANDDTHYLPVTLQSILTQNLLEYEVILIDSGTGKNSEFIRRFAYGKNISILRINSNSITQAYNMAIDCSAGRIFIVY